MSGDLGGVLLKLVQIVERIHAAQLASVDQTHVDVADAGTVAGFVKHGVFTMQDRFLQRPFADIVVQWRAGFA